MRNEIEALGRLVDIASELEVGLAELSRRLAGEDQERAKRLTDISDGLADSLAALYIEFAKIEAAQAQSRSSAAG